MISVYLRSKLGKGKSHELADSAALEEFMDRVLKDPEAPDVVLRFPDDETFFDAQIYRNKVQESAQRMCQMIAGASAPCWNSTFASTEGAGWRAIFAPVRMQAQQQGAPVGLNGMRGRT
jgi:hypothetical protein